MSNSDDRFRQIENRAKENRLVRRIVLIAIVAIVVLIIAATLFIYFYVSNGLKPVDPSSEEKVNVTIPMGTGVSEIGQRLEDKGVIKNALIFRYYVKYKNENGFQAGTYELTPSMTLDEVIETLKSGKVSEKPKVKMTFPESQWIKDYAGVIAKHTKLKKADILKKMKDHDYIKKHYLNQYTFLKPAVLGEKIKYPLEGYLFPATYSFTKENPKLDTIIKRMLDKTKQVLSKYKGDLQDIKEIDSVHKWLTLASIVEREAKTYKQRRKITGVFYNRLHTKMPLQTDPTVSYALGKHQMNISNKQAGKDSPYNTYKYKGLPPGPIGNPGEQAMKAVLDPINTDFKYFYARPNGEILYSKNFPQHKANIKKYDHEWDELEKKKEE
ncbi:endolytic transglycosylase MltG [Tuberibacillus sp. Marseille-P3662]|uniref:endolytic transglycosylase MltG n=1 Tax=Tuberibacillus sp. Marseille-P3662 TaxID=1965358 RepID=UPI0015947A89|nr:endolytic transglycosylase MltG [Tuberibacillus sp. Marseille-P3662]